MTSILEAMSMAKPLVVSRSTGIAEYVEDGVSGRFAPVGDAHAFRQALEDFHGDADRAAVVGAENRARATDSFRVEQHAERVGDLLGMRLRSGPLQRSG